MSCQPISQYIQPTQFQLPSRPILPNFIDLTENDLKPSQKPPVGTKRQTLEGRPKITSLSSQWTVCKKFKSGNADENNSTENQNTNIPSKKLTLNFLSSGYKQPNEVLNNPGQAESVRRNLLNGNSTKPWASQVKKIIPPENPMKGNLNEEQKRLVKIAAEGKSVFFTGSAGTGKSFVLKIIVEELQKKYGYGSVFITASTGMAACNIQGVTLHSFSGLGLAKGTKEALFEAAKKKNHVVQRWNRASALIIDEISMISADYFTKVEYLARNIRESGKPFGGVQVILCGDFFQLPPVGEDSFCFESEAWEKVIDVNIELKEVIRQKNPQFVNILNEIRVGKLSAHSRSILQSRVRAKVTSEDGIIPTKLYPHRVDVIEENKANLNKEGGGDIVSFYAVDTGDSYHLQQLDAHSQAPKVLELKIGCQVMLLKNLDFKSSLVNGSRGVIVGFTSDPEKVGVWEANAESFYPVVRFANANDRIIQQDTWRIELAGQIKATRTQFPLTLAYSISIHKSQGMSIEKVDLSLGKVFTFGQAYVALSRATSLEGLTLSDFSPSVIKAHPKVIKFYSEFKETTDADLEFMTPKIEVTIYNLPENENSDEINVEEEDEEQPDNNKNPYKPVPVSVGRLPANNFITQKLELSSTVPTIDLT